MSEDWRTLYPFVSQHLPLESLRYHYLDEGAGSPLLMVHGTADGLVPVEQVGRLQARRQALGLHTETLVFEDAPHAFLNWPGPLAEETAARIAGFLTGVAK